MSITTTRGLGGVKLVSDEDGWTLVPCEKEENVLIVRAEMVVSIAMCNRLVFSVLQTKAKLTNSLVLVYPDVGDFGRRSSVLWWLIPGRFNCNPSL